MSLPPPGWVLSPGWILLRISFVVLCLCLQKALCERVAALWCLTPGYAFKMTWGSLLKMWWRNKHERALFGIIMCRADVSQTWNGQSSSFFKSVCRLLEGTKLDGTHPRSAVITLSFPSSQTGDLPSCACLVLENRDLNRDVEFQKMLASHWQKALSYRGEGNKLGQYQQKDFT